MNPLLSLSFLSSGQVAAGTEPASYQAGAALDEAGAANDFGRLLNQSGEQQLTDRQSFAALHITGKGKGAASMAGHAAGGPAQTQPSVIPAEAELSLADESQPGTLLGLLDLASQTRLQLQLHATEKGQSAANTVGVNVTHGDDAAQADDVDGITAGALAGVDGKKVLTGEWFILPVYPATANAGKDAAESDTPVDSANAAAKMLAAVSNGQARDAAQSPLAADDTAQQELKNSQFASDKAIKLAEQALANQNSGHDTEPSQSQTQSSADMVSSSNKAAIADANVSNNAIAATGIAGKQATQSINSTQSDSDKSAAAAKVSIASAGQRNTAQEGKQQVESAEPDSAVELPAELKASVDTALRTNNAVVAEIPSGIPTSSTAAPELKTMAGNIQPPAATTIFENAEKSVLLDAGQPASTLASAAAVADSAQSRAQQRAGLAESNQLIKQMLTEDADLAAQQVKTDVNITAGSIRAETAVSGFGSIVSPAGQTQSEAALARLDAATVAIAGAQQSAERAKAQSVNKSVTEHLKQVNLLSQDAAGQLKERLNLMVRQNIQVAEIRLDPADLGQMQIRVNLQQEQASVQFIVQQQHAKELLEQQMPRLREMLQQQGIQLGEGQVQQQRQGDSQTGSQRNGSAGTGQQISEPHLDEQATALQLDVKLSERIVDYYA